MHRFSFLFLNIVLAGLEAFAKHRCELSRFKSGGICIFVKDELVNKVKIIDTPNKSCMWMKVKVYTNNQYENLLLGAVYIPPENSKYVSNDVFEVLEEYFRFSHDCKYVCMIGDFNARTGTNSDFLTNLNGTFHIISDDVHSLDKLNIPYQRTSEDSSSNNFGNLLLKFCKHTGLYIANGRIGDGKNTGKTTCKGESVIDYCIGNYNFLSVIDNFHVHYFSHLLSDCHNPIHVKLNMSLHEGIQNIFYNANKVLQPEKVKRWNDDLQQNFIDNLHDKISAIDVLYDRLQNTNGEHVDTNFIDTVVKDTCNILISCAKETFGVTQLKNQTCKKMREFHKPWFTKEMRKCTPKFP